MRSVVRESVDQRSSRVVRAGRHGECQARDTRRAARSGDGGERGACLLVVPADELAEGDAELADPPMRDEVRRSEQGGPASFGRPRNQLPYTSPSSDVEIAAQPRAQLVLALDALCEPVVVAVAHPEVDGLVVAGDELGRHARPQSPPRSPRAATVSPSKPAARWTSVRALVREEDDVVLREVLGGEATCADLGTFVTQPSELKSPTRSCTSTSGAGRSRRRCRRTNGLATRRGQHLCRARDPRRLRG